MPKSKIFFYCCLFFILGVFVRSLFTFDFFVAFIILLLGLGGLFLFFINRNFFIAGLLLIFLFLGVWRFDLSVPKDEPDQIHFYNGQKIEIQGVIVKEPDTRQNNVKLEVKTRKVLIDDSWQSVNGKVLVTAFIFPEHAYGERLQIVCDLQKPEPIDDFQYDQYLARYNIYSLCYYPKITVLGEDHGNFFLTSVYRSKNFFVDRLNRILPEPQSSFLAGLLLGAKKSMPQDLQFIFKQTGTSHIVAVSGYNLAIIAAFLLAFSQNIGLPRKKSFWLIVGILIVFTILTGLQASIVRAAIMAIIVLWASYLGRLSKIRNVLALTAVLMLLINPKVLVFDLGFQLSFLATLGLVYLNPVLLKLTKIETCKLKFIKLLVGDYFLTTMSAIIMTTPIILYNFGTLSLIAPLANILVLPAIPLAMLLGFIAGSTALIFIPLGWVLAWSVWLVLSYIIWILSYLSSFSWASWQGLKISWWVMVLMYLIILALIWGVNKSKGIFKLKL